MSEPIEPMGEELESMSDELESVGEAPEPRTYAIAVARFYEELAERLLQGAQAAFAEAGFLDVDVHEVPGAFELPLAASYAARSGRYAGVACLGAVIRGETDHYDFVCAETARGIMQVQLRSGVPCAFGVLTCDTMEQALARAGGGKRDQGRHAAQAVLRLAALRDELLAGEDAWAL
ncbi:MAG TPA: 6,7-dimethyl-8-ribityllumazine synthase [Solirubrobacteraceae bacterium]|nr:6,7-dimethyl-8-ribityllumazine synthase [Solirubrobacteraceae bacterium]